MNRLKKIRFFLLFTSLIYILKAQQWQEISPGPNLEGWIADPTLWWVKNGILIGRTTEQRPIKSNSFIIWKGGRVRDFELNLEFKLIAHNSQGWANSGIQYRSELIDLTNFIVGGYQADMDAQNQYTGILYEERGRGILALQGQRIRIEEDGKIQQVQQIASPQVIRALMKTNDWNFYKIVAVSNYLRHEINGQIVVEVEDRDLRYACRSGLLALQLHQGLPMEVQFKNIRLREINPKKKFLLIAGPHSHGEGEHEHVAGLQLLAGCLNRFYGTEVTIVEYWPKDLTFLYDADAVVIYADGGEAHLVLQDNRIKQIEKAMNRGSGLGIIHYALDMPDKNGREAFLRWIGGYYETYWSVNPTWTARFKSLPLHPVTQGVKPFEIMDEWYYHMRFVEKMEGVMPILVDLPPAETLRGPDGPHSNNPYVRKDVLEEKIPQVVMWIYERKDGGRGFGFTGGHFHRNWFHDDFRKLVLNAIIWIARDQVPEKGVECQIRSKDLEKSNR